MLQSPLQCGFYFLQSYLRASLSTGRQIVLPIITKAFPSTWATSTVASFTFLSLFDCSASIFIMPVMNAEYSAPGIDGVQPQASGKLTNKITSEKCCNPTTTSDIDIIDIRCDAIEKDLKLEITSMLKPANGSKKLPTLLLYDERGLQIFERVSISIPVMPLNTHSCR